MSVLSTLPGSLPKVPIPHDVDVASVVRGFPQSFQNLTPQHFVEDAIWRDVFALTGSSRTFYTAQDVSVALKETSEARKATPFKLAYNTATVVRHPTGPAWITAPLSFQTLSEPCCRCEGLVSFVLDGKGEWRIWILRTILGTIADQPDPDKLEPDTTPRLLEYPSIYDCIVVGAGPHGLGVSGRLKAMGLSYLCIDRYKEIGGNWKNRYDSVRLHTVRAYTDLPFHRTFDSSYPEFIPKDDIARGYTDWVKMFNINLWLDTTLQPGGRWDASNEVWDIAVTRAGEEMRLRCRHLVLAIGPGAQYPVQPQYPDRELFKGIVLHSADYKNARAWQGKRGIVVGSGTTGHDVADDMYEAGCHTTMLQRSRTTVIPQEVYVKGARPFYNDEVPTAHADAAFLTQPLKIAGLLSQAGAGAWAEANPQQFDALEKVGFKVERHGNLVEHVYDRLGGHYMDIGTSQKIADGKIKVKSDSRPVRYTETGLEFDDGSHLDADVIVFTTGFQRGIKPLVKQWLGSEISDQVTDFGGLDEEGEPIGAVRPTGHPNLWYVGINFGYARYYSRFVALQIKAAVNGKRLPLYEKKFAIPRLGHEQHNDELTS